MLIGNFLYFETYDDFENRVAGDRGEFTLAVNRTEFEQARDPSEGVISGFRCLRRIRHQYHCWVCP